MFKFVMKAVEGGSCHRRFLRDHKRSAEPISTTSAKHPKTMPAIAGPDNIEALDA